MAAVGAVAVLLLAALILLVMPKSGTLIVTVAGPNNRRIDTVEVFVDGAKKCPFSPCKIEGLDKGAHTIRVAAAGYADTADKVVEVGKETIVPFELTRASEGTGIRVTAEGTGLKLFVDGREVGPLPQELTDLTPGDHVIRVGGNDRYAPYEEHVSVETDKVKTIGPLQLKVVKGLAMIEAGANAEGAKVLLVSGSERRPIPKLPIKLDIRTDKSYRLVAIKKGFANFQQPIEFEPGKAEKTFVVELTAGDAQEESVAVASSHSARRTATRSSSAPRSSAKGATGTLNINSIPASTILLDGTPKGSTPKVGLKVSAGPHTVLFINKGVRKAVSVNVPAGGKVTAATRF
ncbi:MAG: PEGA domain-containing protein [Polyangiaceae bacterium]|nr:PEGA domain-containing protein [Polyangiaceae bacterium]